MATSAFDKLKKQFTGASILHNFNTLLPLIVEVGALKSGADFNILVLLNFL